MTPSASARYEYLVPVLVPAIDMPMIRFRDPAAYDVAAKRLSVVQGDRSSGFGLPGLDRECAEWLICRVMLKSGEAKRGTGTMELVAFPIGDRRDLHG